MKEAEYVEPHKVFASPQVENEKRNLHPQGYFIPLNRSYYGKSFKANKTPQDNSQLATSGVRTPIREGIKRGNYTQDNYWDLVSIFLFQFNYK